MTPRGSSIRPPRREASIPPTGGSRTAGIRASSTVPPSLRTPFRGSYARRHSLSRTSAPGASEILGPDVVGYGPRSFAPRHSARDGDVRVRHRHIADERFDLRRSQGPRYHG